MKEFEEVLKEVQGLAQGVHTNSITPANQEDTESWVKTIITIQGDIKNEQGEID